MHQRRSLSSIAHAWALDVRSRYGLESLNVAIMPRRRYLVLRLIVVPVDARRRGVGSAAMTELCNFADLHRLTTILWPADRSACLGTTSRQRLVKFYSRFGFVENIDLDWLSLDAMYRRPRERHALPSASTSASVNAA